MFDKLDINIIVPVFNEYENLKKFFEIIDEKDPDLKKRFLFVDNGSTDKNILKLLLKANVKYLQLDNNMGFGGGIKHGIINSSTEYICWMPCNLKIDPLDALNLIKNINILKTDTLYKSTRIKDSRVDAYKTILFSIAQSLILKKVVFDTGGTPTIVSREFFKKIDNFPDDYSFETYVYLKAKYDGLHFIRPKIKYGKRMFGKSHWQNGILSEVKFIMNIYYQSKKWIF